MPKHTPVRWTWSALIAAPLIITGCAIVHTEDHVDLCAGNVTVTVQLPPPTEEDRP